MSRADLQRASKTRRQQRLCPRSSDLKWPMAFYLPFGGKRITAEYRDRALAELMKMSITTDTESNTYAWTTRLQLAERFGSRPTIAPI